MKEINESINDFLNQHQTVLLVAGIVVVLVLIGLTLLGWYNTLELSMTHNSDGVTTTLAEDRQQTEASTSVDTLPAVTEMTEEDHSAELEALHELEASTENVYYSIDPDSDETTAVTETKSEASDSIRDTDTDTEITNPMTETDHLSALQELMEMETSETAEEIVVDTEATSSEPNNPE